MNPIAKRTITALTTAALVVTAILYAPVWVFPYAFGTLALLAAVECWQLVARRRNPVSPCGLAVLVPWLLLIGGAFYVLPYLAVKFGNLMMLYIIAIVKVSDMGGFAAGVSAAKLMKGGTHKLCPTVSPNKSWEGLGGSVAASCIVSCLFMPVTHFSCPKALAFGVTAALVGTAGDLVESKLKRWSGVKDSATFMPAGLGGFLDMFDSLLLAPSVLLPFI